MYPALSVLQALQVESSQSHPAHPPLEVVWVGSEGGMEEELVRREKISFLSIPAAGIHGVGWRTLPRNLVQLKRGFFASRRILRDFQPEVLFFTGGYVAIPMALAAYFGLPRRPGISSKRPRSLVFIPDVEPGWALKVLLRLSDHVALSVDASRAFLSKRTRSTVTGYPIRRGLLGWDRSAARSALNLRQDLPVFLALGGSRGARSINQALWSALPQLLPQMQILHVSGQQAWEEAQRFRDLLPQHLALQYHPYPYLHAEMGAALAAADLVLSRAGASCLGEYPIFGLPAILTPYPYAWRYQQVNAEFLAQHGAAVILPDAELATQLVPTVMKLMTDEPLRRAMAQAMLNLSRPEAAQSIARILMSMTDNVD